MGFSANAMQPNISSGKLQKIMESRYLKFLNNPEFSKEGITRFFSQYKGFYGGDCYMFNVAVKLILDKDCKNCLSELLDKYEKSDEFLVCRSTTSKKTVLHHLFEHVDTKNFEKSLKDCHRIITLHNSLVKAVDSTEKVPEVPETCLPKFEKAIFESVLKNYDKKDFVSSSLLAYYLNNKKYTEIETLLNDYDKEKSEYIKMSKFDGGKTYLHLIVSLITKENYLMYYGILAKILELYPDLKDETDDNDQLPLYYINYQKSEEHCLTDDQITCLKNLFTQELPKKRMSLFGAFIKK